MEEWSPPTGTRLGQTRGELARDAGVSGLSIYRVEKGRTAIAVQVLRRVAIALNLSLAALCAEAEGLAPRIVIEEAARADRGDVDRESSST